jgi:hypothetical protein
MDLEETGYEVVWSGLICHRTETIGGLFLKF